MKVLKMIRFLILILSFLLVNCQRQSAGFGSSSDDHIKRFIIYYTNDEHGWMEPNDNNDGAPGLMGSWKKNDGFQIDEPFLVLSGGDMWTGPAISTLTSGKSMVEVMNTLGYNASALGNHEFDFSVDTLRKRLSEMDFPILAANIREKESGHRPDFVLPYTMIEINDVTLGIIGLTTLSVPTTTKPAHVADYYFTAYDKELKKIVPVLHSEGAELIILIGHLCHDEMLELAPLAHQLGIPLIGGGHCHQVVDEKFAGVTLIQSGSKYDNYVRVEIFFDDLADTLVNIASSLHSNTDNIKDMSIESVVTKWRTRLTETISEVIGYTSSDIQQKSNEMQNMITDSWLFVYPSAQIALTNTGGIRQSLSKGNITVEMIFGLLPFENNILELDLSGKELLDCITSDIVYSGMIKTNDGYKLSTNRTLYSDSTYRVLTNDYLYSRPDLNYQKYDDDPYDTSINYRQPLIDWLRSVNSTEDNPINTQLDTVSRR
jgi:2',3'-cyclic-nucleotide 2'-phosphodiesterase (5'-nucleotidase family)